MTTLTGAVLVWLVGGVVLVAAGVGTALVPWLRARQAGLVWPLDFVLCETDNSQGECE